LGIQDKPKLSGTVWLSLGALLSVTSSMLGSSIITSCAVRLKAGAKGRITAMASPEIFSLLVTTAAAGERTPVAISRITFIETASTRALERNLVTSLISARPSCTTPEISPSLVTQYSSSQLASRRDVLPTTIASAN
jgi:hypothetical protein